MLPSERRNQAPVDRTKYYRDCRFHTEQSGSNYFGQRRCISLQRKCLFGCAVWIRVQRKSETKARARRRAFLIWISQLRRRREMQVPLQRCPAQPTRFKGREEAMTIQLDRLTDA